MKQSVAPLIPYACDISGSDSDVSETTGFQKLLGSPEAIAMSSERWTEPAASATQPEQAGQTMTELFGTVERSSSQMTAGPEEKSPANRIQSLEARVKALESRIQEPAHELHSDRTGVTSSSITALLADVDQSLLELQQDCSCRSDEASGKRVEAQVAQLRQQLRQRAAQGLRSAAGLELQALQSDVARVCCEVAEMRDFVVAEVADCAAYVEERIHDAAPFTWQPPLPRDQALQSEAVRLPSPDKKQGGKPSGTQLVQLVSDDGSGNDGLSTVAVPHAVAELWHCLQLAMHRVQGLKMHSEEHLSAVQALVDFAEERISLFNGIQAAYDDRIADAEATARIANDRLAELQGEQARMAAQILALLPLQHAPSSGSPRQGHAYDRPLDSSSRMEAANEVRTESVAFRRPVGSDTATLPRLLVPAMVTGVVGVLVCAIGFCNETLLVAT